MFKTIILLKRRADLSSQDFSTWWLNDHAKLAAQLPGLRKLCFNLADEEDAHYDGVSELWFESKEAFEAAYTSEIGQAVAADSQSMVSQRVRLFVSEHLVHESC